MCNPFIIAHGISETILCPESQHQCDVIDKGFCISFYKCFFDFWLGFAIGTEDEILSSSILYTYYLSHHRMSCMLYLPNGSSFKWNIWIFLSVSTQIQSQNNPLENWSLDVFGEPIFWSIESHRIGEFSNDFGQVIQLLAPWQRQVWMVGVDGHVFLLWGCFCVFQHAAILIL